MAQIKSMTKKLLVIIITISLLISFVATPSAQAKLTLEEGEFYYSGTTKGTYKAKTSIFAWLLNNIGDIADWLLGIITMGFRMVFVGWTALIEKILTWTLEGTTGVNVDGENVSSTDLTSLTDSSNNVTVQAIVYNQVPALSIDFFNLEYDKTYSGTGKKLHCQKCEQDVDKCCTSTGCSCKCKGNCDDCRRYIAALNVTGDPVIVQIKKVVATWYYIMRFLSAAAMLIVFLGVGIKMAISTIASEKAVYKRMLVDWVVGAIIVFSIHYLMIFVVHLNNILVDTVKESAKELNKVSMMQLAEKSEDVIEYTNEELEIDIYEAVRTRAYDAKLVNGMIGMIMYMTLVYFAIRYTIVYLKRLLTLIVLTLMAPAVGVAYALQKVFSGKSSSLTTWMTEYIMNVLIQVVHAIIYSVFISTALVMSLQSVSGMILALILMNYALKAEKTFRTIFKMGGNGSLLDDTASSGDADKIQSTMDSAKGLVMGAKPMANALMNSPYAKALKGVGKVGVAAGLGVASLGKSGVDAIKEHRESTKGARLEDAVDKKMIKELGSEENFAKFVESDGYEDRRSEVKAEILAKHPKKYGTKQTPSEAGADANLKTLFKKGEQGLRQDIVDALKSGDKTSIDAAIGNYNKFTNYGGGLTQAQIAKAHAENLVDVENHFNIKHKSDGSVGLLRGLGGLSAGVFGTKHYDYKTGKMVSDNNGLYTQLSSEKLLGLTAEDKKLLKQEVFAPITKGLGGIAAMFVGMGTIVAHPKLGMGLLAGGYAGASGALKRKIDPTAYNGTYSFARFSTPTMKKMQKEAVKRARDEWNKGVVDNVKDNHPDLYKKIQHDLGASGKLKNQAIDLRDGAALSLSVGTIGAIGGVMPQVVPLATVAGAGFMAKKLMGHTGFQQNLDRINKHSAKQLREQQMAFLKNGMDIQAAIEAEVFEQKYQENAARMLEDEMAKQGLVFDEDKKEWVDAQEKAKEDYDKVMVELYAQQGMEYDPKTGITKSTESDQDTKKIVTIEEDDIRPEALGENAKISANAIKEIKKELDREIEFQLKTMQNFDINDATVQGNIIKKLNSKLSDAKIIGKNVSVEDLFKEGSGKDFRSLVKNRAQVIQNNDRASQTALKGMKPEVQEKVKDALFSITQESEPGKTITVQDVMSRMQQFDKGIDKTKASIRTDGSQKVSSKDGTVQVPKSDGSVAASASASKDGSLKLSTMDQVKIQEYIANIQSREQPRTVAAETKSEKSVQDRSTEARTKAVTRKRKLDQIMKMDLSDADVDGMIDTVSKGEQISINRTTIASEDSQNALEMLFLKKELESINQFAMDELKPKDGSKGYKEASKDEGKKKYEYYEAKIEYDHAQLAQKQDSNSVTEVELNILKRNVENKKKDWDTSKAQKVINGPIMNVGDFVESVVSDNTPYEVARPRTTVVNTARPRRRVAQSYNNPEQKNIDDIIKNIKDRANAAEKNKKKY